MGTSRLRALGVLGTMARNRLGRDERPRMLTYTVTFKCNARCIMCDSWKIRSADDLALDEIESVFRQLPRLDMVRLTGGEPFVRADFGDIVDLAVRHLEPLALQITTNGFLTEQIVEFCAARARSIPLYLLVSLDGYGDKHDQVRGRDDAWSRTLATLEQLAPRQDELNIVLAVNQTVVDPEGVEHYRKLRELLQPLGVRHQMVMAYDTSATYSVERDLDVAPQEVGEFHTFGEMGDDHLETLLQLAMEDLAHLPWRERLAKRYYLNGLRGRLLSNDAGPNPACVALHNHLRIFPNGDVPTCQFNSSVVGSLRNQSFDEVWRSVRASEQRRWVRACPGCWAECEVLPNALYTGDLFLPRKTTAC